MRAGVCYAFRSRARPRTSRGDSDVGRWSVISIVMATYNRADTLPRAIDSVLKQTHRDWELIIVDDGSTDASAEVLAGYDDPRILVYKHPHNRGVTAAKNTGLGHIRGEWFSTFDSDDEWVPDALEAMLACADETGATAVNANCVDSVTGEWTGYGPTTDCWLPVTGGVRRSGQFCGIVKTELLGDLRFDERLPGYEGTVWLKISLRARRYYLHRALCVYHTEGADRVTKRLTSGDLREKVRIFSALGEDGAYLRAVRLTDPATYRRSMLRIRLARLLHPFVGRP